ncbi:MAG: hypothetical protein GC159_09165 [Phycisphaera sp.]|nr:hypothetical protein [Phycisphaera sp.]
MLSIVVFGIIAFMMYWWASQGLFSAFMHLICTILAGILAFAFWEPLTLGMLINKMPEYAWGVGLLVPFGGWLLALRLISDKLIGGNLNFHNVPDQAVGAAFGGLAGVLTTGMLLIGLQMTAMPGIFGFKGGWELTEDGTAQKSKGVFLGVDRVTADFFTTLSRFSFAPSFSDVNLNNTHPDLSAEAGLFHRGASEFSRRVIRPGNASIVKAPDPNGEEITHQFKPSPVPKWLENITSTVPGKNVPIIIGTSVKVQGEAADQDGTFRISRGQISLAYSDNAPGFPVTHVAYPIGYLQNGEYGKLSGTDDYAYSLPAMADVVHHWLFLVPEGSTPEYLRVKNLRITLGDKWNKDLPPGLNREGGDAPEVKPGDGPEVVVVPSPIPGFVTVSAKLPFQSSLNKLGVQGVDLFTEKDPRNPNNVTNYVLKGIFSIRRRSRGEPRPGTNIAVDNFFSPNNARIVQADLGNKDAKTGLLGGMLAVESVDKTPFLIDNQGNPFKAIGYARGADAEMVVGFDPNKPIEKLVDTDPGKVSANDHMILYFQVPVGRSITSFKYGKVSTPVSPPVPLE